MKSAGGQDEAIGGDAESGSGAMKGDAVGARGATIDEGMDLGEEAGGGVEEVLGAHGLEIADEGPHFCEEGVVFLEYVAAAAPGAVGGAEFVSAFGDAAAFAAVGKEVGAFFDHESDLLGAIEKAHRVASLF